MTYMAKKLCQWTAEAVRASGGALTDAAVHNAQALLDGAHTLTTQP